MRKLILAYSLIVGALFAAWQCFAQIQVPLTGAGLNAATGGGSYTGIGDVKAAWAYWGLRAYNQSYATAQSKLVNVCNPGDAACADFSSSTSGNLVTSYVGGVSCSEPISSGTYVSTTGVVTLTTSASASLSSGNPLAVTGLTGTGSLTGLNGMWTATTGTSGTTVVYTGPTGLGTVSITGGTVSVCTVKTMYDQSGNTNCQTAVACSATQPTIADRPMLALNCIGTKPCVYFNGNGSVCLVTPHPTSDVTPPYAITALSTQTVFNSIYAAILVDAGIGIYYNNTDNLLLLYAGTLGVTLAATDNTFYGIIGDFETGTPVGNLFANATSTTGNSNNASLSHNTPIGLGCYSGNSQTMEGRVGEWAVFSSSVLTSESSLMSNMRTYWGI
jgi:hypothetical protein